MSLRLNLYGCRYRKLIEAIKTNDQTVYAIVKSALPERFAQVEALDEAARWLELIFDGTCPLAVSRTKVRNTHPTGLLVSLAETDIHAATVFELVKASSGEHWQDFAEQSSHWGYPCLDTLSREIDACGFKKSRDFKYQFTQGLGTLSSCPLFGDRFQSSWSSYGCLELSQLDLMISQLESVHVFRRVLEGYPEEYLKKIPLELTSDSKELVSNLMIWLKAIRNAGNDAFLYWY